MQIVLLLLPWLQINVAVEFKRSIPCPILSASVTVAGSASDRVSASLETQLLFLCSLHVVIVR